MYSFVFAKKSEVASSVPRWQQLALSLSICSCICICTVCVCVFVFVFANLFPEMQAQFLGGNSWPRRCVFVLVYLYLRLYLYAYVCLCLYLYLQNVFTCICMCMFVCICVCKIVSRNASSVSRWQQLASSLTSFLQSGQ